MSDSRNQMSILQDRVRKIVEKMMALHNENKELKEQVLRYKDRIGDLESLIDEYQDEQDKIQEDIISTLKHIESLDELLEGKPRNELGTDSENLDRKDIE